MSVSNERTRFGICEASVSDLVYGIRKSCIAGRLTIDNWSRKALWRMALSGPVYVNINQYQREPCSPESPGYVVKFTLIDASGNKRHVFRKDFDNIEAAVAYANGEKGGPVALLTRDALASEIPADRSPAVNFMLRPGLRGC